MKNKIFGIITPLLTVTFLIGIGVILAIANDSGDGWQALGAIFMVFMLTGLVLIVMFVVALVVYFRKKSDYALGIVFGVVGIFSLGIVIALFGAIF